MISGDGASLDLVGRGVAKGLSVSDSSVVEDEADAEGIEPTAVVMVVVVVVVMVVMVRV